MGLGFRVWGVDLACAFFAIEALVASTSLTGALEGSKG